MTQITPFRRDEETRLDLAKVGELEHSLGHARCHEVMADVCMDLVGKTARLDEWLKAGELDKVSSIARALAGLSKQIGLEEYSRAALNIHDIAQGDDAIALAAATARLRRLGENALLTVLELTGMADL